MSATCDSSPLRSSGGSGIGHIDSPTASEAAWTDERRSSSLDMIAAGTAAEGDDLGTRERRDVDDDVGGVLGRAGQRVAHDEPALGVGVEHLDGLAAVGDEDVGRAGRRAGRHVLGHGRVGRHVDGQAKAGDGDGRGDDCGRPAHVALHRLHAGAGLIEIPPVSKVMPLPISARCWVASG